MEQDALTAACDRVRAALAERVLDEEDATRRTELYQRAQLLKDVRKELSKALSQELIVRRRIERDD